MDQFSSPGRATGNEDELMNCPTEARGGTKNESTRETSDNNNKSAVNDHANDDYILPPATKKQKQECNHSSSSTYSPSPTPSLLPNKVTLDPVRKLFRLRKSKGKTLAAGGFGVSVRVSPEEQDVDENHHHRHHQQQLLQQTTHSVAENVASMDESEDKALSMENGHHIANGMKTIDDALTNSHDEHAEPNTKRRASIIRKEFLFVEEVIFLYERGLMDVHDENNVRLNDSPHRIYGLLQRCGLSLPLYLVYAHARQQSYRVVRHGTATRHEILKAMEKLKKEWVNSNLAAVAESAAAKVDTAPAVTEANVEATAIKSVFAGASEAHQKRPPPPPPSPSKVYSPKDVAMKSPTNAKAVAEFAAVTELGQSSVVVESTTNQNSPLLKEQQCISHGEEYRESTPGGMPLFLRSMKFLEQRLREEIAPPPKAAFLSSPALLSSSSSSICDEEDSHHTRLLPPLAWDVYLPDVTFQRSRPGLPAFSILVTHYAAAGASSRRACVAQDEAADDGNESSSSSSSSSFLSFSQLQALARANRPVPIKIATVSDSGTVVVFGLCAPSSSGDGNDEALVPSIAGKDSNITTGTETVVVSSS